METVRSQVAPPPQRSRRRSAGRWMQRRRVRCLPGNRGFLDRSRLLHLVTPSGKHGLGLPGQQRFLDTWEHRGTPRNATELTPSIGPDGNGSPKSPRGRNPATARPQSQTARHRSSRTSVDPSGGSAFAGMSGRHGAAEPTSIPNAGFASALAAADGAMHLFFVICALDPMGKMNGPKSARRVGDMGDVRQAAPDDRAVRPVGGSLRTAPVDLLMIDRVCRMSSTGARSVATRGQAAKTQVVFLWAECLARSMHPYPACDPESGRVK